MNSDKERHITTTPTETRPDEPDRSSSTFSDAPEPPDSGRETSREIGGRAGPEPEPARYGDWEKNGRCIDF